LSKQSVARIFDCNYGPVPAVIIKESNMQTLGISDSTPQSENRLKSLFWPSIQSGTDVDYLGAQGYWVCAIVAVFSFIVLAASGQALIGTAVLLFYYLGGVGVRERSRYAATAVFILYALGTLVSGIGVVKLLFGALLLSNLRATWIASAWKPESEEASLPPRLSETWNDKFTDKLPSWLWPKVRILYYIFSVCMFVLLDVGVIMLILRRVR
jgi:hypothetical protein